MRRTFYVAATLGFEPRRGKIAKRSGNCWPIADATRPHRAQLYDSARALENIYPGNGDGAFITMAEAVRRLTIAKEKEIVLDMEIKRGARIPTEDVSLTEKYILFFGHIRGVIIASKLSAEQKMKFSIDCEIYRVSKSREIAS